MNIHTMKEIINVVKIMNGVTDTIESFIIDSNSGQEKRQEIVEQAENRFIEMINEVRKSIHKISELDENDKEYFLDEGYYEIDINSSICLCWSDVIK